MLFIMGMRATKVDWNGKEQLLNKQSKNIYIEQIEEIYQYIFKISADCLQSCCVSIEIHFFLQWNFCLIQLYERKLWNDILLVLGNS